MIINVPYKPNWLGPTYNPIIWSVESSKINETDFKYVFDVYVDGVKVNRIKQRPNPSGYGMIDVSNITEGLIDWADPNAPKTQGETEIDWVNGKVYHENEALSKHVMLKVGEEYTVSGLTQIYTGVADTVGEPAYNLYSGNTTNTGLAVRVWSASLQDHPQQWHLQQPTGSGVFGSNPFEYNRTYDHGVEAAYPLMHADLNQNLYRFDKMILSWLNWSPYPTIEARPIYGFRWIFKGSTGNVLSQNDVPLTTAYGFSQRATCDATVPAQLDPKYDIVHVLASPTDLVEALNSGLFTVDQVYTIEIQGFAEGASCAFGDAITQKVTLNLQEYCTPLYERVRLSWFNDLGSRDYLNFTMFLEKSISTTQGQYSQEQMDWSNAVPVPQINSSPVIQNLGIVGGDKIYNKQATTTYKIQSDWLTQAQVNLLEGLQKSPQVLAYIHDPENSISDNYAYACNVSNTQYSVKNVRQVKLYQASFDLTVTQPQKLQNIG